MTSESPPERLYDALTRVMPQVAQTWSELICVHTKKIDEAVKGRPLFDPIASLILDLAKLIDDSPSADQVRSAVENRFTDVLQSIRSLGSQFELSVIEVTFVLQVLRLALSAVFADSRKLQTSASNGEATRTEATRRLDMLLARLSSVNADSSSNLDDRGQSPEQALALEYALMYERTRQLAITDALTGLYNFGYFWERLREECARAERYQRLLSLIFVDIDHFKHYNDHNGHPAGNEVLRRISRIMQDESREVDVVARYGGEELVILSPETNRRHAHSLAERVRQRIADTVFPHRQSQPSGLMTVSSGVATYPVDANTDEDLVRCADQALYVAKQRGRNQVVAYMPPHKVSIVFKPYRTAQTVALVGNFNAWDPKANLMSAQGDGSFVFDIALTSGTYQYKFVLDEREWLADETVERQADNFGGENNILRVKY